MSEAKITKSIAISLACLFTTFSMVSSVTALELMSNNSQPQLGNDETEFIFASRCPNGNMYRIFSYQMDVDGLTQSFYDYEGPAGRGTVRTNASPKKMALRVCHELADINNGSKYD